MASPLLLILSTSMLVVPPADAAAATSHSVTISAGGFAVKQHKQLVRTEKTEKNAVMLPEQAGSFSGCQVSNGNHVPLPNSQHGKQCSAFDPPNGLVECQCKRIAVDGVAIAVSEQRNEFTCCHREITNTIAGHFRCYTDCFHPQGNNQTAPNAITAGANDGANDDADANVDAIDADANADTSAEANANPSLEEEEEEAEVAEETEVEQHHAVLFEEVGEAKEEAAPATQDLPEQSGSFQKCRASGTNFVQSMANSGANGKRCSELPDAGGPKDANLAECLCERIASLGQAVAKNSSNMYDEEYTCCPKNMTQPGTANFDCYSNCVRE